ncbi:MAG TPA: hypothetical protein VFK10_14140 [Burkholderiaceae bacterium]|nr:hypothetical protein [Burkholderiaceae bacterium]
MPALPGRSKWSSAAVVARRGCVAASPIAKPLRSLPFAVVVCLVALAGCATTTYKPFETRGDAIFDGKGGVMAARDGMEIWNFGDPPRRYKVLGFIDDERPGAPGPMSRLYGDVVTKAREVGGEALIQLRNQSQIIGYQSTDSATAPASGISAAGPSTSSVPVRRNKAQFIVIRYVD